MNKAPENTHNLGMGNFAFLRNCLNSVKLLSLSIALSSQSLYALDSARAFKASNSSASTNISNVRRSDSFIWRLLLGSPDTLESLKTIVDPVNKDPFSKIEEEQIKEQIENFSSGRIKIEEFSKNLFKIIDANPDRDSATKASIKHNVSLAWGLPSPSESQFVDLAKSKGLSTAVIVGESKINADLLRIANSSRIDAQTGRTLVAEGSKSNSEIDDASAASEGSSFVASDGSDEEALNGRPVSKDDATEIASVSKSESGGNKKIDLNSPSGNSIPTQSIALNSPVISQDNAVMAPPDTGVVNSAVGVGGIALAATLVDRNLRSSPLRRPSSVTTSSQAVSPNSSAASNTVSSSASAVSPVAVSDLGTTPSSASLNSPHTSITAAGSRMPASVVAAPIPAQTSFRAPVTSNFEAPRMPEFNTIPSGLNGGVHSLPELASSAPARAERPYTPPLLPIRNPETASAGPKSQTGGDAMGAETKSAPDSKPKVQVADNDGAPKKSDHIIRPEEADPIGRPRVAPGRDCLDIFRAMAATH
jgi:hypothetical protein